LALLRNMGVGDRLKVKLADLPDSVLQKGEIVLRMVKFNSPSRGKFEIEADHDVPLEVLPADCDRV
jgi:hypothetical protein